MRTCERRGCASGEEARWSPGLRVYPPEEFGDVCANSVTSLAICDECRVSTTLGDLLTDEAWARIVVAFAAAGHVRPDRGRTELVFTPLPDPPS